MEKILLDAGLSIVFGILGIILLIVGYFIISGVVENDFQDTDTSYIIRR